MAKIHLSNCVQKIKFILTSQYLPFGKSTFKVVLPMQPPVFLHGRLTKPSALDTTTHGTIVVPHFLPSFGTSFPPEEPSFLLEYRSVLVKIVVKMKVHPCGNLWDQMMKIVGDMETGLSSVKIYLMLDFVAKLTPNTVTLMIRF